MDPKLHHYPIPKIEDIFARLEGEKIFTKLDLSQAYQQPKLDAESQKHLVINTHKGLFHYTCLLFGVSSAPRKRWRPYCKGFPIFQSRYTWTIF